MKIRELTRAEEQVMQLLWESEKAFVKELIEQFPEPKPAYNTVSTIVRILETKGFIGHDAFGKSHRYYPLISREQYKSFATSKLLNGYFSNSPSSLLSYFIKDEKIDLKEMDELMKLIDKAKK